MSLTLQLVSSKPSPFKSHWISEMQLLKKTSEAGRAKFDELRRTLQYVEASRASATKYMRLFSNLLAYLMHMRHRCLRILPV